MTTTRSGRDLLAPRARSAFLLVMYALLLWSVPLGLIGGVWPDMAAAIIRSMRAYFEALPEPLYALFGTGYLGYTAARTWGKVRGVER
ncbi:3TM-type holin [Sphingobium mellinum]|uniref:3TM-type holin n=1 Tax=Sphingobium mellinum TaxID=1387166 RepID=UPI0030EC95E7